MPLNNTQTHSLASADYAHSYFSCAIAASTMRAMNIADKIKFILKETGWTQSRLASELKTTQPTVNRWLTKGSEPEGHRRDAINDLYDDVYGSLTPDQRLVDLKGKVGAGQAVYAIDAADYDQKAIAPADAHPNTVAVLVSGDSMFPAFEEGTLLYYSKLLPPDAMVNRRAVVQLGDGRIFVKILRPGSTPRTWTLQSVNAQYADMIDEVVEWAAPIDWIRPRQ